MDMCGLVDSHLHLMDFERGTDIPTIIQEAANVGVSHLVCNATSERDWHEVLALGSPGSRVVPCLGLHPWFVAERSPEWLDTLRSLIGPSRCGVGECGLDRRFDEHSDREDQESVFKAQIGLARKFGRPLMVHCVRAWGWLMDVLRDEPPLPAGFLLHAYAGPPDMIGGLARMGAYFSFSAAVLNPDHKRARDSLVAVPVDRLLVETDAPNMVPPDHCQPRTVLTADRRLHNHPANLPLVADGVAVLLGVPADELREHLWQNSKAFLGDLLES